MSKFVERNEHIKDNDAYGNYLNTKKRKGYEELKRELGEQDNSLNNDEEDDDDEDSAASNKEVFASVGMIFIPVLICCMLISLFSKPKENSKEDASAPLKAEEQVEVDNTVEEESIDVTGVIKDSSAFLEEQKAKTKDILQDMKDEILKGFDIDWSDLLVDH